MRTTAIVFGSTADMPGACRRTHVQAKPVSAVPSKRGMTQSPKRLGHIPPRATKKYEMPHLVGAFFIGTADSGWGADECPRLTNAEPFSHLAHIEIGVHPHSQWAPY
jgi:hypothetical protein